MQNECICSHPCYSHKNKHTFANSVIWFIFNLQRKSTLHSVGHMAQMSMCVGYCNCLKQYILTQAVAIVTQIWWSSTPAVPCSSYVDCFMWGGQLTPAEMSPGSQAAPLLYQRTNPLGPTSFTNTHNVHTIQGFQKTTSLHSILSTVCDTPLQCLFPFRDEGALALSQVGSILLFSCGARGPPGYFFLGLVTVSLSSVWSKRIIQYVPWKLTHWNFLTASSIFAETIWGFFWVVGPLWCWNLRSIIAISISTKQSFLL